MRKDALLIFGRKYSTPAANFIRTELSEQHEFIETGSHQDFSWSTFTNLYPRSSLTSLLPESPPVGRDAPLFQKLITEESRCSLPDRTSLLDEHKVREPLLHIMLPMADARVVSALSACSSFFYSTSIQPACWKDKLLKLGCNKEALETLIQKKVIQNYKVLYAHLNRLYADEIPQLKAWELCCLSGECSAIKWAEAEEKLNKDSRGTSGRSAVHYAGIINSVSVLRYCIQNMGIDPLTLAPDDETVLHMAAKHNALDVVKFLIEIRHIDPSQRARYGATVLLYAAWGGALETLRYLIEDRGLSDQDKDQDKSTLMDYAAWSGSGRTILYCHQSRHFPCHLTDEIGRNALRFAAWTGRKEAICMVRYLAQRQAKPLRPKVSDALQHTAAWYAGDSPNPEEAKAALEMKIFDVAHFIEEKYALEVPASKRKRRKDIKHGRSPAPL